jgi:hypothetical protein
MKTRTANLLLAWLALSSSAMAADSSADYATDLAIVYGGYQQILAMKDACDKAVPGSRAANDKAFTAWAAQHRVLLQELQRRVTAMIRLASTDEKDYTRNLGKYEGEMLQMREEHRDALLKRDTKDLRSQCRNMPGVLKGPEADLAKVYAVELEAIRQRK